MEEVTVNTGFAYEDARFISKLFNRDVIYDETYVSSVDNSLNDISSYASAIRDLQSVGDGDGDGDGEEDSCKETDGFWKSDTEDNDTRLSTLRKSNKSGGGGGGGGNKAKHNTKKRRVKSQTRTAAIGTAKPATTISMTITPFSTVMAGITAGDPPPPTSPNDHQYSGDNDNETVWGIGKEKEIAAYGDKHLLKWGYSPKRLWKFSGEHSLEATFLYFFGRFDLFSDEFPYNTMARWISAIAGMYTAENPYHNARHAADALQAACYIIGRPEVGRHLDKDMRLALLVAVAVHDIMHLGRTNAFLCSIMSPVAIEYSDRSVEENNSVALAFALMKKRPELNIFAGISPGRYYYLRRLIIRLVLVTDMAKYHAPMTQLFKNRLTVGFNPSATNNSDNNNNSININSNIEDASSSSGGGGSSSSSRDGKNKHLSDNELLCVMIIKGADISNAMRKFSTSKMWGESLTKEFYLQGDAEKARGLPVSSFMDRSKPEDFPSSQCAFISYFCLEFFGLLCQYAGMNEEYELLKSNLSRWETMKKKPEATANMSSP